ncbi:PWWP domain [Phytophthora cactorum]|nr:PWWP domain [Phytophthora cactorum]
MFYRDPAKVRPETNGCGTDYDCEEEADQARGPQWFGGKAEGRSQGRRLARWVFLALLYIIAAHLADAPTKCGSVLQTCWQKRRQVRTFEDNFDKKRTGSTGQEFEQALKLVLQSVASTKMPKFAFGALPLEYKFSPTESVEAVRRNMGDEEWFQRFAHNQMHHKQNHVYETLGDEEDDALSDDFAPPTLIKTGDDSEEEESMEIPDAKDEEDDASSDDSEPPTLKETQDDIEEEESMKIPKDSGVVIMEISDAKDSEVVVVSDQQTHPVHQDSSTNGDDKDDGSQPCQQFCEMQPDKEGTDKLKFSKKTVISVSRKFDVAPPQEPAWYKSTMPRIAPPPRLTLPTSSTRAGAALAAPSTAITIRTPGTLDGIKNLSLENRLELLTVVVMMYNSCWQKKRQVKILDSNFDKNRKQTNGAQFELALGSVLQSDATTKMPTFARGTLPLQYENSTTESVERMRKIMGNRLCDESVPKLKVRRPKTSPAHEEQDPSPQKKKKRPFPAKEQPAVVKIEQEPLARIGLGDMDSSDDQRARVNETLRLRRSEGYELKDDRRVSRGTQGDAIEERKTSSCPGDTNAASSMPRHVTVMMDEIIVDDDEDSGDDEVGRRKWREILIFDSFAAFTLNEDDWEDEEKGVLRDETKEVELHEKTPKTSVIRRQSKQCGESKQDSGSSVSLSTEDKPEQAINAPQNPVTSDRATHCVCQRGTTKSGQEEKEDPKTLRQRNGKSDPVPHRYLAVTGRLTETSLNLDFPSNQLGHSFLSVDHTADNSDCQEESPTLFDEDMALDFQSDPKEAVGVTKAEAKSLPEVEIVASVNQRDEDTSKDDDDGEEKAQEVPRRFCVMQAGLEGTLDVEDDENAKPRNAKKTVISVPRKFDGVTKGAAYDFTSSTAGSPSSPTAIFSSSKGFSMEKWVKTINGRNVLDDEGIWNTGVIVDVGKEADEDEDKVEVKYDGWGDEYNQWIDVATQRLAPLHTYTIVKKCWAKLTKWPWWPAFVREHWQEFPKFVEGTQRAKAGTSPLLFSGLGTLPIEYSSKMAEPLEEKKKECTTEQWFHLYRDFSNRYQDLYGYSTAPEGSKSSSSPGLKSGNALLVARRSIARDSSNRSVVANHTEVEAPPSPNVAKEPASLQDIAMLSEVQAMEQCEPVAPAVKANRLPILRAREAVVDERILLPSCRNVLALRSCRRPRDQHANKTPTSIRTGPVGLVTKWTTSRGTSWGGLRRASRADCRGSEEKQVWRMRTILQTVNKGGCITCILTTSTFESNGQIAGPAMLGDVFVSCCSAVDCDLWRWPSSLFCAAATAGFRPTKPRVPISLTLLGTVVATSRPGTTSTWMTVMQQHHSPASSYADTDVSDSDSDNACCDDCQCRLEVKRKFVTKDAERVWVRTAPISIPSNGRQQPHPHLCKSVVESPDLSYHADMRLLRASRYLHEEDNQDELDEDDPAFYGNLAFFRSQYGASQTRMVKRTAHPFKSSTAAAAPPSPTGVDDRDDEEIFAMELCIPQKAIPHQAIQAKHGPLSNPELPVWASIQALPSLTKPGALAFDDEDPLYLSGEETDCDSERGSDTLSREDQQLMASFIRLQKEKRAHKHVYHQVVAHPATTRTTPLLIPPRPTSTSPHPPRGGSGTKTTRKTTATSALAAITRASSAGQPPPRSSPSLNPAEATDASAINTGTPNPRQTSSSDPCPLSSLEIPMQDLRRPATFAAGRRHNQLNALRLHKGVAEPPAGCKDPPGRGRKMETLVVATLGIVFAVIVGLIVQARWRSRTVTETDSSDDETSGPLSVNVVADHDEQDSLLPKFAGLLRSPWHSVTTEQKEQPKMTRLARKGSRSMSLTMPLPLRKKRKSTEVPVKKIHVPYFFPLLDETSEWWQGQQSTAGEPQPTPEQEPEESHPGEDELSSSIQNKRDTQVSRASAKEILQVDRPRYAPVAKVTAAPIEIGGR